MSAAQMESLLRRIEEGKQRLMDSVASVSEGEFAWQPPGGQPIRRVLEEAADDVNFFYGHLLARARGLPPAPCVASAQFLSVREASLTLQVVHRRFANLLHDLTSLDLDRTASHEDRGTFTLRQVLEMAADHYLRRAEQVEALRAARRKERTARS